MTECYVIEQTLQASPGWVQVRAVRDASGKFRIERHAIACFVLLRDINDESDAGIIFPMTGGRRGLVIQTGSNSDLDDSSFLQLSLIGPTDLTTDEEWLAEIPQRMAVYTTWKAKEPSEAPPAKKDMKMLS